MKLLQASYVEVSLCTNPKCGSLHITLCNEDGKRFAMGAIGPDQLPEFVKEVMNLAYQAAAMKEDACDNQRTKS